MQERITEQRMRMGALAMLVAATAAGCSSPGDNPLTIFADPGKHQYTTCEQLAGQRRHWTAREQELQLLMDKAEQSAGGALVNMLAYKADHVAAQEELKIIEITARAKNCERGRSPAG